MENKVYIVGIGPGNKDYILPKAIDTLKKSDLIIGFERAIESIYFVKGNKVIVKKLTDIIELINSKESKNVSVVASGDPLFYGITDYLKKNYKGNIEIIPGLSSFQYMMSKIGKSWQGTFLGSLHGREDKFNDIVRDNAVSIWLTDKKHTPAYICKELNEKNVKARVYVGENLSYEDEKITIADIEEMENMSFSNLCVAVVENLEYCVEENEK
ncbi:precorrin-6y C5,15-methyltransferase (decarboxylating) subunit CbiE [Clostridium sp. P21]|uniref:Precorrin-6y C5,15-methyltransferase (Decarboxylating) subunit CbiE n=1 Tax=Clostridium muellerianum TaxID=2716538 RepID=A0A7Y0EJK1_9CLOT|nr:precorrin-6y C5,15-methyltransferase (decarboxylating) subunit CbiE [Clostridium muellerianum]NMM64661.1 precorrin-6y C5,15-methyltransferase (decarboxylating) subunit CbiE [Clostridium muellerianum]